MIGNTIPWMLHGPPSRNGITRTRSQCAAKCRTASSAFEAERTQRTNSAPPLKPSRISPDHTEPVQTRRRSKIGRSRSRYPVPSTRAPYVACCQSSSRESAYELRTHRLGLD